MLQRYQQIAGPPQESLEDSYLIRRLRAIVEAAYQGCFNESHDRDLGRMLDYADQKLALYAEPLPGTEAFFAHATRAYARLIEGLEQLLAGLDQGDEGLVDGGLELAEQCELELQELTRDVRRERSEAGLVFA